MATAFTGCSGRDLPASSCVLLVTPSGMVLNPGTAVLQMSKRAVQEKAKGQRRMTGSDTGDDGKAKAKPKKVPAPPCLLLQCLK